MTYATAQDIIDLYGEDLLRRLADRDKDGLPDDAVVADALQGADEICNAYLSAQFTVPVVPTPGIVRTCAIDIAVYRMAIERAQRTDEMRLRYEDALKILDKIAKGDIGIGLPPGGGGGGGDPTDPGSIPLNKGRTINAWRA